MFSCLALEKWSLITQAFRHFMASHQSVRTLLAALAVLSFAFASVIPARAAVTVLDYYRMGEGDPSAQPGLAASTASDSAGPNPLPLSGSPIYSSDVASNAASQVSSRLSLDFGPGAYGTNALISTLTDDFGFEAWIKPTTVSGSHVLVYNGNTASSGWGIRVFNGAYSILFGGVIFADGGTAVANEWTHVALVRASGVATLYVNGVSTITTALAPNTPAGTFALATVPGGGGDYWVGKIDEVRFFTFVPGNFSPGDLLLNRPPAPAPYLAPAWRKANVPGAGVHWNAIASSAYGNVLVAGAQEGHVYTSTDYGATWKSNNFGGTIRPNAVASSADGKILVAAVYGSNLRVSTDSGATWTPRGSPANWATVACSSDGTKIVACPDSGQARTSTDSGATWTPHGPSTYWTCVVSSADGSTLAGAATQGPVQTSTDSGTNWTSHGYNYDWNALACSADGSKLVGAIKNIPDLFDGDTVGGVSRSGNSGVSWNDPAYENTGLNCVGAASSSDGNHLAVCAIHRGGFYPPGLILVSTNFGSSWDNANAPIKWWSSIASSADGTKLAATYHRDCQGCPEVGGIYTYAEPTAEFTANTPALNIATVGGSAQVSWPYPSTGYVLQQNANPATPNWTTVSNPPAVVNQVTAPATNNQNFYRLFKP